MGKRIFKLKFRLKEKNQIKSPIATMKIVMKRKVTTKYALNYLFLFHFEIFWIFSDIFRVTKKTRTRTTMMKRKRNKSKRTAND
jgi:hypothetical protein